MRTAILMKSRSHLLIDCGPDIASQLSAQPVPTLGGVLISHEHGDHYLGLDELFVYKRTALKGSFEPIPVYLTAESWEVIGQRFRYLEDMGVIRICPVRPQRAFEHQEWRVFPFKTDHGSFASGSVGYMITVQEPRRREVRIVYTSDFMEIPEIPREIIEPDYLIIQSFWFNEPEHNRPRHMSFQHALHFIEHLKPRAKTFLVHMGDADMVPGDPANSMIKKYRPLDPLKPPGSDVPYAIPLHQEQWQQTVNRVLIDWGLDYPVTVAHDGFRVRL